MQTRYFLIDTKVLQESRIKILSETIDLIEAEFEGKKYYFVPYGNSSDFSITSWHATNLLQEG